jgi:hypothetical protein
MDCTENTVPLLLFMGHCLVMAVVLLLISWSLPRKESACYNIMNILTDHTSVPWRKHCEHHGHHGYLCHYYDLKLYFAALQERNQTVTRKYEHFCARAIFLLICRKFAMLPFYFKLAMHKLSTVTGISSG